MNQEQAKELVIECAQAVYRWDSQNESYSISIRNSISSTITVESYDLGNTDLIEVLDIYYKAIQEEVYYTSYKTAILFRYGKGYGVAIDSGWSDMTFSGYTRELMLHESFDFSAFDRCCLTDDLRRTFEVYIIERMLLEEG